MNKYTNDNQVGKSAEHATQSASKVTRGTRRKRMPAQRRRTGPKSKDEFYIRLVAGNMSAFDEPERRYCPDDLELAGFLDGTLERRDQERVRLHVKTCPACRELIDETAIAAAPDPDAAVRHIQRRGRLHQLIDIARQCLGGKKR